MLLGGGGLSYSSCPEYQQQRDEWGHGRKWEEDSPGMRWEEWMGGSVGGGWSLTTSCRMQYMPH